MGKVLIDYSGSVWLDSFLVDFFKIPPPQVPPTQGKAVMAICVRWTLSSLDPPHKRLASFLTCESEVSVRRCW